MSEFGSSSESEFTEETIRELDDLLLELNELIKLGKLLLIYICNFHVLSYILLIYICKLHWNLNTIFVCQVNYF